MTLRTRRRILLLLTTTLPLSLANECQDKTPKAELSVTFPPNGYFSNAPSITVTGTARRGGGPITALDVSAEGLGSVSVLPLQGDPQNGTWSIEVPLEPARVFNPIFIEMRLAGGTLYRRRLHVVSGDGVTTGSVPDGAASPDSVVMRLNDPGLDEVEPLMSGLVSVDLATLLPPGTVAVNRFCYQDSIFGCLGRVTAVVDDNPPPSISGLDIAVDSQNGFVDGIVTLHDLFIKLDVDAVKGIPFSCQVTITSVSTDIIGDYGLEPDALDPEFVDVSQVGSVDTVFSGFDDNTNCGGFLGGIVEFFLNLLVGNIQDLVEPEIETFLNTPDPDGNTPVAGAVEEALAGIEIAGPVGEAIGVTLDTELSQVAEDSDGITFLNDGAFVASPVLSGECIDDASGLPLEPPVVCGSALPCAAGQSCQGPAGTCVTHPRAPDLTASYDVVEAVPSLGLLAPGGLPYDLGLALSSSGFNQLLKSQIECGLLTTDITEIPGIGTLTGAALAFFIPEIAMFPLSTEYKLEVRGAVAPVVTGEPGPGGELARLKLAGIRVALRDVPGVLPGLAKFEFDADAGLDVGLDAGELAFALAPPPTEDIVVAILDNNLGTTSADLQAVILQLLPIAFPLLTDALGGFPLPDFLGLQAGLVEVERAGEYMSLYLDLTPVP